jgi:putative polyketide hydroxylase
MTSTETEVLIVGGGPVGLSAAALLGQAGVDCVVLERKPGTIRHPRASAIHPRTMELFRRLGVSEPIREASLPLGQTHRVGWKTQLVGGYDLGGIDLRAPVSGPYPSAELPCFCSQNILEPILVDLVRSTPTVTLLGDAEALSLEQDDHAVTVEARVAGATRVFRSRYAIGADGVNGATRRWVGFPEPRRTGFAHNLNVYFEADLADATAELTYLMTWIVNGRTRGTFTIANAERTRWTYNFSPTGSTVQTDAQLISSIESALGDVDTPVHVLDVLPWHYGTGVADRWREGRVFLAGDAAHHFPPHGGFGMNSGIQDVENLAWKLAATLRRRTSDALLRSYEAERRPVAEYNLTHTLRATQALKSVGWLNPDLDVSDIDDPRRGAPVRAAIAAGVPEQEPHFRTLGQQLGIHYRPGAAQPEQLADYRDAAKAGHRAPHVWLAQGPRSYSTTDLFGLTHVLLTCSQEWADAASRCGLRSHTIRDVDEQLLWTRAYGVSDQGAVLVRPDGYVAALWPELGDPAAALEEAFPARH